MSIDQMIETLPDGCRKIFRQVEFLFVNNNRYGRMHVIHHIDLHGKIIITERIGKDLSVYKARLLSPYDTTIIESSVELIEEDRVRIRLIPYLRTSSRRRTLVITAATEEEKDLMKDMAMAKGNFPNSSPFKVRLGIAPFHLDPVTAREDHGFAEWRD